MFVITAKDVWTQIPHNDITQILILLNTIQSLEVDLDNLLHNQ